MAFCCFGKKNRKRDFPSVVSERKTQASSFRSENHIGVLTQLNGSVIQNVLPYCILNVIIAAVLYYLTYSCGFSLGFSDAGHSFLSMMISFLVVTRSNLASSRYDEARNELNTIMRCCREIVHYSIVFTRYHTSSQAKEWRTEMARRTIVLLQGIVAVLEYRTSGEHVWKTVELTKSEKQALLMSVGESNERYPMLLAMFLRSALASHRDFIKDPHLNEELVIYGFITEIIKSYHDLTKLMSTPIPFPLVQMSRTFVFIWVFSFPFAFVNDVSSFPALLFMIFFITYGFIGLEFVSIQLDDPFGDDPCDFDVRGLAKVVAEDIYVCLFDSDGEEAASTLRSATRKMSMINTHEKNRPTNVRQSSMDAWESSIEFPTAQLGMDRSHLLAKANETQRFEKSVTLFSSYDALKNSSEKP